jgi:hypothetical protein
MKYDNRSLLIQKLIQWHNEDRHQLIITILEKLNRNEWDYEITSYYARALNNLNRYQDALDVLLPLKETGAEDGKWYFRVGYSLYHLGREAEAAEFFQKAIDSGDAGEDTEALLQMSLRDAEERRQGKEIYHPELYTALEIECLEEHISRHFGLFENIYHEISSQDIHVDIAVIEPTARRNYYTLVTMGMGAHRMQVPPKLERFERAELLICLPPDWRLEEEALSDEKWYWPLRGLKILSRLPINEQTWLGWGHTVPNDGPFAENTELSGLLLLNPGAFGETAPVCPIPGGQINFYQITPLYNEEMEFKINNSAETLLEFFDSGLLECIDPNRKNVCKGWNNFSLKKLNLL